MKADTVLIKLKNQELKIYDFKNGGIRQKGGTYQLPGNMFAALRNKYVHLSAHYGGLKNDYLNITTGDHHLLSSVGFVNQPVKYKIERDTANYKREVYANK